MVQNLLMMSTTSTEQQQGQHVWSASSVSSQDKRKSGECEEKEEEYITAQSFNTDTTLSSTSSKSIHMDLSCQMSSSRLYQLAVDAEKIENKQIQQMNTIKWEALTKKERKSLKKTNEKYYIKFHKVDELTKGQHFGDEWNLAFKELRRSEWEKFKYIARGDE
jgi:hypothetical protein